MLGYCLFVVIIFIYLIIGSTKATAKSRYYGKHLCNSNKYECINIQKGDTWEELFPDKDIRYLVKSLNRTNYRLSRRKWILVPRNLNSSHLSHAPVPEYIKTNRKTIMIDISELAYGAYNSSGYLVKWGPVNPGTYKSPTVKGRNYTIYRKGGARCWSVKFKSRIPYCMFFHRGYAIHGYQMPGYRASHGCVRTFNQDARWLNREFSDDNTRVIVQQ